MSFPGLTLQHVLAGSIRALLETSNNQDKKEDPSLPSTFLFPSLLPIFQHPNTEDPSPKRLALEALSQEDLSRQQQEQAEKDILQYRSFPHLSSTLQNLTSLTSKIVEQDVDSKAAKIKNKVLHLLELKTEREDADGNKDPIALFLEQKRCLESSLQLLLLIATQEEIIEIYNQCISSIPPGCITLTLRECYQQIITMFTIKNSPEYLQQLEEVCKKLTHDLSLETLYPAIAFRLAQSFGSPSLKAFLVDEIIDLLLPKLDLLFTSKQADPLFYEEAPKALLNWLTSIQSIDEECYQRLLAHCIGHLIKAKIDLSVLDSLITKINEPLHSSLNVQLLIELSPKDIWDRIARLQTPSQQIEVLTGLQFFKDCAQLFQDSFNAARKSFLQPESIPLLDGMELTFQEQQEILQQHRKHEEYKQSLRPDELPQNTRHQAIASFEQHLRELEELLQQPNLFRETHTRIAFQLCSDWIRYRQAASEINCMQFNHRDKVAQFIHRIDPQDQDIIYEALIQKPPRHYLDPYDMTILERWEIALKIQDPERSLTAILDFFSCFENNQPFLEAQTLIKIEALLVSIEKKHRDIPIKAQILLGGEIARTLSKYPHTSPYFQKIIILAETFAALTFEGVQQALNYALQPENRDDPEEIQDLRKACQEQDLNPDNLALQVGDTLCHVLLVASSVKNLELEEAIISFIQEDFIPTLTAELQQRFIKEFVATTLLIPNPILALNSAHSYPIINTDVETKVRSLTEKAALLKSVAPYLEPDARSHVLLTILQGTIAVHQDYRNCLQAITDNEGSKAITDHSQNTKETSQAQLAHVRQTLLPYIEKTIESTLETIPTLVENGQEGPILEYAQQFDSTPDGKKAQEKILSTLSQALVAQNQPERAVELVKIIPCSQAKKDELYGVITLGLAKKNNFDLALNVTEKIEGSKMRIIATASIIPEAFQHKRQDVVKTIHTALVPYALKAFNNTTQQSQALVIIAQGFGSHDPGTAFEIVTLKPLLLPQISLGQEIHLIKDGSDPFGYICFHLGQNFVDYNFTCNSRGEITGLKNKDKPVPPHIIQSYLRLIYEELPARIHLRGQDGEQLPKIIHNCIKIASMIPDPAQHLQALQDWVLPLARTQTYDRDAENMIQGKIKQLQAIITQLGGNQLAIATSRRARATEPSQHPMEAYQNFLMAYAKAHSSIPGPKVAPITYEAFVERLEASQNPGQVALSPSPTGALSPPKKTSKDLLEKARTLLENQSLLTGSEEQEEVRTLIEELTSAMKIVLDNKVTIKIYSSMTLSLIKAEETFLSNYLRHRKKDLSSIHLESKNALKSLELLQECMALLLPPEKTTEHLKELTQVIDKIKTARH